MKMTGWIRCRTVFVFIPWTVRPYLFLKTMSPSFCYFLEIDQANTTGTYMKRTTNMKNAVI